MSREWFEVPVRVMRGGETMVIPANMVEDGDVVWDASGASHVTTGFWPDDDEEIGYLAINDGLDHWPAQMFMSE